VIASNLNNLALVYLDQGQLDRAGEYFRQVLALDLKIYGEKHPKVAQILQSLGATLLRGKKYGEAEASMRQALAVKLMSFPPTHWEIATTKNMLGGLSDGSEGLPGGGAAARRKLRHHQKAVRPQARPHPPGRRPSRHPV